MGRLRNSAMKNAHGSGYEKIYTDNNGNNYRIKNSAQKNAHGDGYEQIVEKKGASSGVPMGDSIFFYPAIILMILAIVGAVKSWDCTFPLMIAFVVALVLDVVISFFKFG